ncbi:hypothetical protein ACIBG8_52720 [Nonomuraea sp. NPDC050556]|uniref:hypothetical protein n=1 Tax=Nonomuraea sp. NPDC050556 TaxID=3364369 RepID=UPI0037B9F6FC
MNKNLYRSIMLALSILYGALIAILALVGTGNLGVIAAVGAVVLGAGWALYGIFPTQQKNT